MIQKIPIRGKDKIPIAEHRTKKLQSEHWCCFVYSDCNFFVLCSAIVYFVFPSNWYLLYHWCCVLFISDCNFFVLCSAIGILSFPLIGIFCITGVVFVYSDCNFFVLCSAIGILSFPLIGIFCITWCCFVYFRL